MFNAAKALFRRRVQYPNSTPFSAAIFDRLLASRPYAKRFSIERFENLLLLLSVFLIGFIGLYVSLRDTAQNPLSQGDAQLTSSSAAADPMLAQNQASELRSRLAQPSEQLKPSQDRGGKVEAELEQPPSAADLVALQKQTGELRTLLAQSAEQLKASQDRVRQLEAQPKQIPSAKDLSSSQKQVGELRTQLARSAEQLKGSQERVAQLEAELKQAPNAAGQKQADQVREQLAQSVEQLKGSQERIARLDAQLKASQDRIGQLEAQLKQAPSGADLATSRKQADELGAALARSAEQLKASQDRIGQLEAQLKQAPKANDLSASQKQADELRAQLARSAEQLKRSQERIGQLEAQQHQAQSGASQEQGGTPLSRPAQATEQKPSTAHVSRASVAADTSMLVARGDSLVAASDIAAARLFYERGADAGDGLAALRLGETYDPAFLERAQLPVKGDGARATFWYRRARELGARDAEILLKGIQTK